MRGKSDTVVDDSSDSSTGRDRPSSMGVDMMMADRKTV